MKNNFDKLFYLWLQNCLAESNDGLSISDRIRPRKASPVYYSVTPLDIKLSHTNQATSPGEIILYTSDFIKNDKWVSYSQNTIYLDEESFFFPNSTEEVQHAQHKVDFNDQKSIEHENSMKLGYSLSEAFGISEPVDLKMGYNITGELSTREKKSRQVVDGKEVTFPLSIPPGGAKYSFKRYIREHFENYDNGSIILQGKIIIYFDNMHPIAYENGRFIRRPGFFNAIFNLFKKNYVEISIVDIIRSMQNDPQFKAIFREPSSWEYIGMNRATYRGLITIPLKPTKEVIGTVVPQDKYVSAPVRLFQESVRKLSRKSIDNHQQSLAQKSLTDLNNLDINKARTHLILAAEEFIRHTQNLLRKSSIKSFFSNKFHYHGSDGIKRARELIGKFQSSQTIKDLQREFKIAITSKEGNADPSSLKSLISKAYEDIFTSPQKFEKSLPVVDEYPRVRRL